MTSAREFPCEPEAVTAARRFVREVLSGTSPDALEAAELMTSELATNCVRHARTGFALAISAAGDIRIEVRDTGGGSPKVLSPEPREPSGRGLRIVEALAEDWGVISASSGKTVWFTLLQSGPADSTVTTASDARPRGKGAKRDTKKRKL